MVPAPSTSKTIVVVGASWCGIAVSHQILRSLPEDYTVTLISPSDHVYWNIAAVRAVAKDSAPGLGESNNSLHHPFLPGFAKYSSSNKFTFLQGKAERVDTTANTVTYLPLSDEAPTGAGPEQTIEYAHLIVASGSRAHGGWPFKSAEPLSALKQSLQQSQKKITEAQTIVLAGGGPTSIETAGEIATFYPDKKIILASASETLLPTAPSKVGNTAEKTLKQVGVEVRKGVKVVDYRDGEVVLENDEKLPADLYIPSAGLIPNSGFLPKELVAENGGIKVNENLRTGVENVWALGDVLDVQDKRLAIVGGMVPVVSANVLTTIKNAETTLKTYDESKLMKMMFVPIGSKFGKGTGHVGGYKVPGLIVWAAKSRDMMVGGLKSIADGKMMPGFVKV